MSTAFMVDAVKLVHCLRVRTQLVCRFSVVVSGGSLAESIRYDGEGMDDGFMFELMVDDGATVKWISGERLARNLVELMNKGCVFEVVEYVEFDAGDLEIK